MYDLEFLQDTSQKAYLKRIALNTVVEFVARTIAQSEFRVTQDNKIQQDNLYYLLNVKPNPNQNAVQFWQKFIYKAIVDNEALVIVSDDDYLFVADDFEREERMALVPQRFHGVMINEFQYDRYFEMEDVIHIEYANEKLEEFMLGLFEDYGEIFGRMINLQLKQNQVRGVLNVDTTQFKDNEKQKRLQNYIDTIFEAFNNNQTAIVPLTKGLDYEEHSNKGGSKDQTLFDDLENLKKSIIMDVARIIGVPPALILGETADLEKSLELFFKTCAKPLVEKLESELNGKMFYRNEYLKDKKRISIVGVDKRDPLELSEAIDKLRSSGTYTGNQIRTMVGDEPGEDEHLDEYVLTKNYTSLKGGEEESDASSN